MATPFLDAWGTNTSTGANPATEATQLGASIIYNGFIYLVGGRLNDAGGGNRAVRYASISAEGVIGTWASTTVIPQPGPSVVQNFFIVGLGAHEGRLYVMGGDIGDWANFGVTNDPTSHVLRADINATTGALGAWTTMTAWPDAVGSPSAGANLGPACLVDGFIYRVAGQLQHSGGNPGQTLRCYYTALDGSGNVGAWVQTTSIPTAGPNNMGPSALLGHDGYLYVMFFNSSFEPKVYRAPISESDGSLGTWDVEDGPLEIDFDTMLRGGAALSIVGDVIFFMDRRGAVTAATITIDPFTIGVWGAIGGALNKPRELAAVMFDNEGLAIVLEGRDLSGANPFLATVESAAYGDSDAGGGGTSGTQTVTPSSSGKRLRYYGWPRR